MIQLIRNNTAKNIIITRIDNKSQVIGFTVCPVLSNISAIIA
jgi:hypothetical protein